MPLILLIIAGVILIVVTPYATLGWIFIAAGLILMSIFLLFFGGIMATMWKMSK